MQMLNSKITSWFLVTSLLLGLAGSADSMSQPPTEPILMEFVRVVYEKEFGAIISEWVVPDINTIEGLGRIELLISQADNGATFGVMLNRSDRCNPIPPGNFGVIIDPSSDDRSIKNVSSTCGHGRFDHTSPNGTLLKQSTSGVVNGNLGISIWIIPQGWNPGRYVIKTRAVKRKHSPAPWQEMAEFDYTGAGVEEVTQNRCLVEPTFFNVSDQSIMPFDHIGSVVLIHYERQKQDKGVVVKSWAGDASREYKYVEKKRQEMKFRDLPGGLMSLEPGIYQFKHNSVHGQPPSGFYGESNVFEIREGEEIIKVKIFLNPAI